MMIPSSDIPTRLTPLQQELLKLYAMELKEDELREVKDLLARYFLERLQRKATSAARKKGYTREDFDQWLNDPAQ